MSTGELTCERHRSPTRLTCVQCGTPICPQCLVRTPVGLKCVVCGAAKGGPSAAAKRARWVAPLVIGVVLLAIVGLPRLFSDDDDEPSLQEQVAATPTPEGPARFALLGEEVRDGNLAFVASAFECGATEVSGGPAVRTAQGRFCFLTVTLRNSGRTPVEFFGRGQALQDNQNRRYGIDDRATTAHPANAGRDPMTALINPANELQSVLVFDVPGDVDPQFANLRATPRGRGAWIRLQPRS